HIVADAGELSLTKTSSIVDACAATLVASCQEPERMSVKATVSQRFCAIGGIVVAALLLGGGCAGQKQPAAHFAPPGLVPQVTHYLDLTATGATTQPATNAATTNALAVSIQWMALEQMPTDGALLAGETRVLSSVGGGDPLLVLPKLTRGTRIVRGADLDTFLARLHASDNPQAADLGSSNGALPTNVTASFTLAPS